MSAKNVLIRAAAAVAILTVLSKVLGFVREASLAAIFGATHLVDAYLVGQTIPFIVFSSVGIALGTSFIPVYASVQRTRGREAGFRMADSVINSTVLAAVVLILLGQAAAAPLTHLVAPGFQGDVFALTVRLTRLMFPMVLFQVLAGVFAAMLQSEGNFIVPATVGVWLNVLVITSVLFLGPRYGIVAVAAGSVLAVGLQAGVQVPALRRAGYRWRPRIDWHDPALHQIARLSLPVLIGSSVGQAGLVVDRVLASQLAEGSISSLNYASKLMQLAPAVLGTAITTVMYPTLARLAAAKEWSDYGTHFSQAVRVINFLMVPVAVGIAILRVPLVTLAFQRGAFGAEATGGTAWALLFFSPAVAFFPLRDMVNQAFYSFQDTVVPMVLGTLSVLLNVALNLWLVRVLRQGGLALSTSLAAVFGTTVLIWLLRRRVTGVSGGGCPGIGLRSIVDSLARVVLASAVMGAAVSLVYGRMALMVPGMGVTAQSVRLFSAVGAGVVVYAGAVWMLRVPEMRALQDLAGAFFGRLKANRAN